MLKILWKRGAIAPEEQFLLLSIIFCYLMLDFYMNTRIRFSLRDKRLFEITEVEKTSVDCIFFTTGWRLHICLAVLVSCLWLHFEFEPISNSTPILEMETLIIKLVDQLP